MQKILLSNVSTSTSVVLILKAVPSKSSVPVGEVALLIPVASMGFIVGTNGVIV